MWAKLVGNILTKLVIYYNIIEDLIIKEIFMEYILSEIILRKIYKYEK